MSNLQNALQELRERRTQALAEIEKLNKIISDIEFLNGIGASRHGTKPKRVISAASRRKMARAQKARWANMRKEGLNAVGKKPQTSALAKRTMSVAGRKRIAAAQRARWKKLKAQQDKVA